MGQRSEWCKQQTSKQKDTQTPLAPCSHKPNKQPQGSQSTPQEKANVWYLRHPTEAPRGPSPSVYLLVLHGQGKAMWKSRSGCPLLFYHCVWIIKCILLVVPIQFFSNLVTQLSGYNSNYHLLWFCSDNVNSFLSSHVCAHSSHVHSRHSNGMFSQWLVLTQNLH